MIYGRKICLTATHKLLLNYGITLFLFGEVYHGIYGREISVERRCKLNFRPYSISIDIPSQMI